MTEAALARARRNRLSPLEALEGGFALFRSTFAREAWRYYTGSAPFALCFLFMWVINGQIRISDGALLTEAALLAGGYLLRVWMVGSYMQRVRERAFGTPRPKPAGAAAQVAAAGRLLRWKIMLGAGALIALPSVAGVPWLYSACQFASLSALEDGAEKHSLSECLTLASEWFGGGLLLWVMLFPLWVAIWLNGTLLAMILPQLLHSIFGVNTLLSTQTGIYALVRSSAFWLSAAGGAWLALDPIVKCTFAIVYQVLRSSREGDDLRALLASLPRERQKKAQMIAPKAAVMRGGLLVLAAILLSVSLTAKARAAQAESAPSTTEILGNSGRQIRIEKLRQALDQESQRAIYRWHDSAHPSPPTWLDKLLGKIEHGIKRAWNAFWSFLRKLWAHGPSVANEKHRTWELKDVRLWLTLVGILTLALGAVFFRLRRRPHTAELSAPVVIAPLPDLTDDASPSERSEDEWFQLASRLDGQGELRLAVRAAYLGLLAGLARREWLTIRRDRTNRDYLNEFTRRWSRRPQASAEARAEIPEKLRSGLRQFDSVWYGSHALTPGAVTEYRLNQREFLNYV